MLRHNPYNPNTNFYAIRKGYDVADGAISDSFWTIPASIIALTLTGLLLLSFVLTQSAIILYTLAAILLLFWLPYRKAYQSVQPWCQGLIRIKREHNMIQHNAAIKYTGIALVQKIQYDSRDFEHHKPNYRIIATGSDGSEFQDITQDIFGGNLNDAKIPYYIINKPHQKPVPKLALIDILEPGQHFIPMAEFNCLENPDVDPKTLPMISEIAIIRDSHGRCTGRFRVKAINLETRQEYFMETTDGTVYNLIGCRCRLSVDPQNKNHLIPNINRVCFNYHLLPETLSRPSATL